MITPINTYQYFDIVAALYNAYLSFTFVLFALLMFYVAFRGYKSKNRYGGSSTIVSGAFMLFFGIYNQLVGLFKYPFNAWMLWWVGIIILINAVFGLIVRKKMKNLNIEPNQSDTNLEINSEDTRLTKLIHYMTEENPYQEDIPVRMELARKSFHLLGLLFVIGYFGFFIIPPIMQIVNDTTIVWITCSEWLFNLLFGSIYYNYPYSIGDPLAVIDLTLFALMGGLIIVLVSDFIRILLGAHYSFMSLLTKPILRNKEYNAVGPHIYLFIGVIFLYILCLNGLIHILVVTAGILISSLSDGIAALVGKKYGNHKIKCIGGDIKSLEGFLVGSLSAYVIGLICVGPILAIVGAAIFFLLDFFPIYIADNLLNPILIPMGIQLFFLLLNLPIGWF